MQVMPPIPAMMPAPTMMMPEQMLSDVEQSALNEVARLIEIKKTSNDPRLQNRIEQILEEYPNLISFFKSKIEG